MVILFTGGTINAAATPDDNNVVWTSQSSDITGSMPIGNGDIGANVWVAANVIHLLVSKTDAWTDPNGINEDKDGYFDYGLTKLCKLDITLSPNPFSDSGSFTQTLDLLNGEVIISQGNTSVAIWIDAKNPIMRVEAHSNAAIGMTASLDASYGTKVSRTIVTNGNTVAIYHRNQSSGSPYISLCKQQGIDSTLGTDLWKNRTFGCVLGGTGFTVAGNSLTKSAVDTSTVLCVSALTQQPAMATQWITDATALTNAAIAGSMPPLRTAHRQWWSSFWQRSWITLGSAHKQVAQGYALQRYVTACAGRGAYPIKFNGSIFTFDDYRRWGTPYWFQNTRLIYWPLLATGDYDCMQPLFTFYAGLSPVFKSAVKSRFHIDDALVFPESMLPCGSFHGSDFASQIPSVWKHFNGTLEFLAMMLDYYDNTRDEAFARDTVVPFAQGAMTFWDLNFPRSNGKLYIQNWNALETFVGIDNPAPDVAGLTWGLSRILSLPPTVLPDSLRTRFTRFAGEIPPLPTSGGLLVSGTSPSSPQNGEQTELYSVFPYRIYGLGKPGLDTAIATFNNHRDGWTDWNQGAIMAALLGRYGDAWSRVDNNFAPAVDVRFPAFWSGGDGQSQQCSGGVGMYALQKMLAQTDNKKIYLFAAWDKTQNVDFRLWLPNKTIVEATLTGGTLTRLAIGPLLRKNDIVLPGDVTFDMSMVVDLDAGSPRR